ncbi:MAG: lysophospholipase [Chloroflexota bacterium]
MRHNQTTWKSFDGLDLHAQSWDPPAAPPRAVICLVHGLGEHARRYQHVAQAFTNAGCSLFTFDLRGHGRSGGPRGHTPSDEAYLKDIDQLLDEAAQVYPDRPRFIYGHSLGGLLVLFYSLRRRPNLAGVIATSPALQSPLTQQKLKIALARTLAKLTPGGSLPTGLDANGLSRDPQVIAAYQADPLVHDRVTFGWTSVMLSMLAWTAANAAAFPLPLLLMHGEKDPITFASGSQAFAAAVKTPVMLKIWPGLLHETHNEPEQAQVLQTMLEWVDCRLDGHPSTGLPAAANNE